ncbi:MAG TPA: CHAT domain-containing protein [Actinoplanes sp.]|nr:CHAT domain-containing protein [Actinoplanes sp.]
MCSSPTRSPDCRTTSTCRRDAADDAKQAARWCLLAGWQRDSSDADLRAAVLTALTGAPIAELAELSVPELLDPPALDEVRRALAELRADVLVYLLAGDDQGPGCAVLVASDSRRPSFLLLPGLLAKGPVARHLDALGTRDAGAADVADGDWRPDLDRLCAWAWPAAIGPLLRTLDGWRIGRAPRIVLIPMGDLAAVPWHAALDRDGTRAVEVATFSYAASARLLCRNAERPPVPERVLIVADPTGDLPNARAEALMIQAAFYPDAEVLDAATASPDAVRHRLLAGGASVLHLACHGAVRAGVDGSHLRLSGGRLTARDILLTRNDSTGVSRRLVGQFLFWLQDPRRTPGCSPHQTPPKRPGPAFVPTYRQPAATGSPPAPRRGPPDVGGPPAARRGTDADRHRRRDRRSGPALPVH